MRYLQITKAVASAIWYIHQQKLEQILSVIEAREARVEVDQEAIAQIEAQRREAEQRNHRGSVAVISISGTITQKGFYGMSSLGTSLQEFNRDFTTLVRDDSVKRIVLAVDSLGGSVYGVDETAKQIYNARSVKPIIASVSPEAFSAGYYLASAAEKVYVQPTGMVGSVGVLATHIDQSKALEEDGLKVTYITAGKYKAEGNHEEPLTDTARAEIQKHVNSYYDMFISALSRNFGISKPQVIETFGQGRVFNAAEAKDIGMVHDVATLEEVVGTAVSEVRAQGVMQQRRERVQKLALDRGLL